MIRDLACLREPEAFSRWGGLAAWAATSAAMKKAGSLFDDEEDEQTAEPIQLKVNEEYAARLKVLEGPLPTTKLAPGAYLSHRSTINPPSLLLLYVLFTSLLFPPSSLQTPTCLHISASCSYKDSTLLLSFRVPYVRDCA